jgi:hypothetical protein
MGCYPLFAYRDWPCLREDLDAVGGELVSVAVVADPFGDFNAELLKRAFRDVVLPFKEHFVADLRLAPGQFVSKHHRYYARKALAGLEVEVCDKPAPLLDEWTGLYANLIERQRISSMVGWIGSRPASLRVSESRS